MSDQAGRDWADPFKSLAAAKNLPPVTRIMMTTRGTEASWIQSLTWTLVADPSRRRRAHPNGDPPDTRKAHREHASKMRSASSAAWAELSCVNAEALEPRIERGRPHAEQVGGSAAPGNPPVGLLQRGDDTLALLRLAGVFGQ